MGAGVFSSLLPEWEVSPKKKCAIETERFPSREDAPTETKCQYLNDKLEAGARGGGGV